MKINFFLLVTIASQSGAVPSLVGKDIPYSNWKPAGSGDVRAPCPMLNTLANHGFLNHNGKNITRADILYALPTYINFDNKTSSDLFDRAILTVSTPNATSFDLDDLDRHGILEHDGSLSRGDYFFGNNHDFNPSVFNQTKAYFVDVDIIDVPTASKALLARVLTSNYTNPTFTLNTIGNQLSYGETAAYIAVLGDVVSGTVNRSFVEYFFENERFPVELGYSRPGLLLDGTSLGSVFERVFNATGPFNGTGAMFPYPPTDLHVGTTKRR